MAASPAAVVHQGVLYKLGAKVKSWTKRWMVLRADNVLYYYKDPAKPSLGSIPLKDHTFRVRAGQDIDLNWPKTVPANCTLIIRTSYRIYYMYAEKKGDAEDWISQLQAASDKLPNRIKPRTYSKSKTNAVSNGANKPGTTATTTSTGDDVIYDTANDQDINSEPIYDDAPDDIKNGSSSSGSFTTGEEEDAIPPSDNALLTSGGSGDAVYELADHTIATTISSPRAPALPLPRIPLSTTTATTPAPAYEDADDITDEGNLLYAEVDNGKSKWAKGSRGAPPPIPKDSDDEDEDTISLPVLPSKNNTVEVSPPNPVTAVLAPPDEQDCEDLPPLPAKGVRQLTEEVDGEAMLPPLPPKQRSPLSHDGAAERIVRDVSSTYSVLEQIKKPGATTPSPPPQPAASTTPLLQKPKIVESGYSLLSPVELIPLNYEPEDDSEEFYIDMDTTEKKQESKTPTVAVDSWHQLANGEGEDEDGTGPTERQQNGAVENGVDGRSSEKDKAEKRLAESEMEKTRAKFESMGRQNEPMAKQTSSPTLSTAADRKKRSGTNMFQAQRQRLVESEVNLLSSGKRPDDWLKIEMEKNKIEEAKLRLERERRKFEEEKQEFELEKRRLKAEMTRLKN